MAHVKRPEAVADNAARKERTRRALVDATIAVVAEKGFANTQIRDIVGKAEVSVGTFYSYFEDKREVFITALSDNDGRYREGLERRVRTTPVGSLEESLQLYVDAYLRFVEENPTLFRCWFYSGAHLDPVVGAYVDEVRNRGVRETIGRLEVGVNAGAIRGDLEIPVVSRLLVALLVDAADSVLSGQLTRERVVPPLVALFCDGIRNRETLHS